jgi:hypothetical protein
MWKGKGKAEAAVTDFHQRLDSGDFESIYSGADSDFKATETEKDFLALLGAIHRKIGNVQSTSEKSFYVNTYNLSTKVTLVYDTKFDGGDATETFVYHISGDQVSLLGYNINSLAMMEK